MTSVVHQFYQGVQTVRAGRARLNPPLNLNQRSLGTAQQGGALGVAVARGRVMCAHALRVGGVAIGACRQQDLNVLPTPATRRQPQGRGARPVAMVHATSACRAAGGRRGTRLNRARIARHAGYLPRPALQPARCAIRQESPARDRHCFEARGAVAYSAKRLPCCSKIRETAACVLSIKKLRMPSSPLMPTSR